MLYYQNLIARAKNFNIDRQTAFSRIQDFTLDEIYCRLANTKTELQQGRSFLTEVKSISDDDFIEALSCADTQLQAIVGFLEEWFDQNAFIGNAAAWRNPDIVVVLGANPPTRDMRAQGAAVYLKDHPDASVILSGGGFSVVASEAEFMQQDIQRAGVANTMYLEEDSMDTITNALFTKFLMKKQKMLVDGVKILIVTSRFHTMRSLFYFEQIFGQQAVFAAHGVPTVTPAKKDDATLHELVSQYNAVHSLGIFLQDTPLDDQDILLKLFYNHALYQNRDDLMRKFLAFSA